MAQSLKINLSLNATSINKEWIWRDINIDDINAVPSEDALAIRNSIHNLFSTSMGDRILLPQYGSDLRTLLYEPIGTHTDQRIASKITVMFNNWLPRVKIVNIGISSVMDDNSYDIDIRYQIPELDNKVRIHNTVIGV